MRTFALVLCVALLPVPAHADHVGLYDSPVNLACSITPPLFQLFTAYVIHRESTGATSATLRIEGALPASVSYLGFTHHCSCICEFCGTPFEGISAPYGLCATGDVVMLSLHFFAIAPPDETTCDQLTVGPYPGEATVLTYDCADNPVPATGGSFSFTAIPGQCGDCQDPVATEPSTWGRLKALYR